MATVDPSALKLPVRPPPGDPLDALDARIHAAFASTGSAGDGSAASGEARPPSTAATTAPMRAASSSTSASVSGEFRVVRDAPEPPSPRQAVAAALAGDARGGEYSYVRPTGDSGPKVQAEADARAGEGARVPPPLPSRPPIAVDPGDGDGDDSDVSLAAVAPLAPSEGDVPRPSVNAPLEIELQPLTQAPAAAAASAPTIPPLVNGLSAPAPAASAPSQVQASFASHEPELITGAALTEPSGDDLPMISAATSAPAPASPDPAAAPSASVDRLEVQLDAPPIEGAPRADSSLTRGRLGVTESGPVISIPPLVGQPRDPVDMAFEGPADVPVVDRGLRADTEIHEGPPVDAERDHALAEAASLRAEVGGSASVHLPPLVRTAERTQDAVSASTSPLAAATTELVEAVEAVDDADSDALEVEPEADADSPVGLDAARAAPPPAPPARGLHAQFDGDEVPSEDGEEAELEDLAEEIEDAATEAVELRAAPNGGAVTLPNATDSGVRAQVPPPAPPPIKAAAAASPRVRVPALDLTPPRPWVDEAFGEHALALEPKRWAETAAADVAFILERASLSPSAPILDVGCGSGAHTIAFGERGFPTTGIDTSMAMLLAASARKDKTSLDNIDFLHADVHEGAEEGRFGLICCLGTTLGCTPDEADDARAIAAMARALAPSGHLVVQVINRDYFAPRLPMRSWWPGVRCFVQDEADFDAATSRFRLKRIIAFDDGRQFDHRISIRLYAAHELLRMLMAAGLEVVEISGGRSTPGRIFAGEARDLWIFARAR